MYPRTVLLRYGETLPPEEKPVFFAIVQSLRTETCQGVEMVMSGALSTAIKDTSVAHTGKDLAQRWLEFTNQEDLPIPHVEEQ
jgi:hypothetical protein